VGTQMQAEFGCKRGRLFGIRLKSTRLLIACS
jgi:hypothetical protein